MTRLFRRSWLVLLLAAFVCAALPACGGGENTSATSPGTGKPT